MHVIELRQTRELAVGDTLVNASGRAYTVTELIRVGRGIRVHYVAPDGGAGMFTAAPEALSRVRVDAAVSPDPRFGAATPHAA